ncbi:M1 family metallopeptidase [Streptomyces sp. NPDC048002]|uniref:M1 family metallopeptidase n=1 Tax=Streptomyces sp. NPDC048002 TaxID=3154344 RepID=UPI0033DC536D
MVSRPRRIAIVPRSVRFLPALLLLALTACGGGDGGPGAGAPGLGDPYFPKAGNGGYDVGHYALDLSYDPARRHLDGTATVTARATEDLSAFNLDLAGLKVEEVTVAGERARFSRDGQELTVRPPRPLDRGETFETRVRYAGTPRTLTDPDGSREGWLFTEDGAVALGEPMGSMTWFPGNHHPADKASYELTVSVPEGVEAVSNGEPSDERTRGGRTVRTWRTEEPMASHVATLAVGDYAVRRSTAAGHPAYTAVDRSEGEPDAVDELPGVMEWAEYNFGPYPFTSTGLIVAPAGVSDYALETQNRPVFPGAPDTALLVHEIAHQWFGNSVSPESWRDMWLNEGFATYAEWLWEEDQGGESARERFESVYAEDDPELWSFPPAKPSGPAHISDRPVYDRGAMVVHRIREQVGDDAFYDLVQGWTARHRHGNADTEDFTRYVEERVPDEDFDEIWADWLYGEGKPDSPR